MTPDEKVDEIVKKYPHVWKTRSAFWQTIKGIIRRGWNRAPQKIEYIKKKRKQIANPNPKGNRPTVWGAECELCHNEFVLKDMEVDHLVEEPAKLTCYDDIATCVAKLLIITEKDLRLICKECHRIVSHSQKKGMTFEEAKQDLQVIAFKKLKTDEQKKVLTELGIDVTMLSTVSKRVEAYRDQVNHRGEK